jgi:hypothetical protein
MARHILHLYARRARFATASILDFTYLPGATKGVTRVTVYPSDYGLERMPKEQEAGPQGIWQKKTKKQRQQQQQQKGSGADDAALNGEEEEGEDEEGDVAAANGYSSSGDDDDDEDGGGVDKLRLMMYERSKLRWYYAVRYLRGLWI